MAGSVSLNHLGHLYKKPGKRRGWPRYSSCAAKMYLDTRYSHPIKTMIRKNPTTKEAMTSGAEKPLDSTLDPRDSARRMRMPPPIKRIVPIQSIRRNFWNGVSRAAVVGGPDVEEVGRVLKNSRFDGWAGRSSGRRRNRIRKMERKLGGRLIAKIHLNEVERSAPPITGL